MDNQAKAAAAINAAGFEISAIVIATMVAVMIADVSQANVIVAVGAMFATLACTANVVNFKSGGISLKTLYLHVVMWTIAEILLILAVR